MKRRSRDFISFLCLIFALSLGAAHGQNLDRSGHGLIPDYFRDNLIWQKEDHSQIDSSRLRYYQALDWGFKLLIGSDDTVRVFKALAKGQMNQVRQILRSNGIPDLRSFLNVYNENFLSQSNTSEQYDQRRIDVDRMATLLHFYRELGKAQVMNPNLLVVSGARTRNDIDLVHFVLKVGRFPQVAARAHGKNQLLPEFNPTSWEAAFQPFLRPEYKLGAEYLTLLAGLTNHEFGHLKFARIPQLVSLFFQELRKYAINAIQIEDSQERNAQLATARDILVIHLMNKDSEPLLGKFHNQGYVSSQRRASDTLAAFIFQLQNLTGDQEMIQLFRDGSLPTGVRPGKTTAALQTLDLLHQGSCGDVFGDPSQ